MDMIEFYMWFYLLCLFVVFLFICFILLYIVGDVHPRIVRYRSERYYKDPLSCHMLPFPSIADKASIYLSIVVPAYNEQERLPPMMDDALTYLEARQAKDVKFTYEIIVVDDGSKDLTSDVAMRYASQYGTDKVRVLTLAKNRGKGGAIRMGVLVSRGRRVMFADADGAMKFAELAKLESSANSLERQQVLYSWLVCGSRSHLVPEAVAKRSVFRTMLMYGFHLLVRVLCVRTIQDTQCGYKLMSRDVAFLLFTNIHLERWAFDVEMLYIAEKMDPLVQLAEVSVEWTEIDGSKVTPVLSWMQMGRDLLVIALKYGTGAWKIRRRPPAAADIYFVEEDAANSAKRKEAMMAGGENARLLGKAL